MMKDEEMIKVISLKDITKRLKNANNWRSAMTWKNMRDLLNRTFEDKSIVEIKHYKKERFFVVGDYDSYNEKIKKAHKEGKKEERERILVEIKRLKNKGVNCETCKDYRMNLIEDTLKPKEGGEENG